MGAASPLEIHIIILDQGIGEKLVGGLLERGFGTLAIAPGDLDVEDLALAHARNPLDAQRLERALDRLSLGIEDAGFQSDNDPRFHDIHPSPAKCSRAPSRAPLSLEAKGAAPE